MHAYSNGHCIQQDTFMNKIIKKTRTVQKQLNLKLFGTVLSVAKNTNWNMLLLTENSCGTTEQLGIHLFPFTVNCSDCRLIN